jgi:hypothetical protein
VPKAGSTGGGKKGQEPEGGMEPQPPFRNGNQPTLKSAHQARSSFGEAITT